MAGKIRSARSLKDVMGLFHTQIYMPSDQGYREFQRAAKWAFERVRLKHCGTDPFVEKREAVEVWILVVTPLPIARMRKRIPRLREWCTSLRRGDADNLAKGILDAATDIIWHDDSQVAQLTVAKVVAAQGEGPRVEVLIRACDGIESELTIPERLRDEARLSGLLIDAEKQEGTPCPRTENLPF